MAIEKLSGKRLFQLIFLMIVLITAFIWRTADYYKEQDIQKEKYIETQDKSVINKNK